MENIDLPVGRGQLYPGDEARWAILLPGAHYLPVAPLLWFAREVLTTRGWSVVQMWDEYDAATDPAVWALERFDACLAVTPQEATRLVVAKSITSLALPAALERDLPGAWLTPLLGRISDRLDDAARTPTLLVGGTADPTWDPALAAGIAGADLLEIEGADHALQIRDDPAASIAALAAFTARLGDFTRLVEQRALS